MYVRKAAWSGISQQSVFYMIFTCGCMNPSLRFLISHLYWSQLYVFRCKTMGKRTCFIRNVAKLYLMWLIFPCVFYNFVFYSGRVVQNCLNVTAYLYGQRNRYLIISKCDVINLAHAYNKKYIHVLNAYTTIVLSICAMCNLNRPGHRHILYTVCCSLIVLFF